MKLINILHHSMSLGNPNVDAWKTGSFDYLFALKIKEVYPDLEFECWRPERKMKREIIWQDNNGITNRVFPSLAIRFNYEFSPSMINSISKLDPQKSAVILHGMYNFHFFALAQNLQKLPSIVQSHGGFPANIMAKLNSHKRSSYSYYLMIGPEKAAFKRYETIFSISSIEKKYIEETYQHKNLYLSPVGMDYNRFQPRDKNESREKLGISQDKKIVLFVGRLSPEKGIEYLLDAMKQIPDVQGDIVLYIVGIGQKEYQNHLEEYVNKLNISTRVKFVGYIPNHILPIWYSAADVFVMPSPLEWYGLVAAEAMACGTPVIVSNAGGAIDIVKEYECGVLVEPKNSHSIAHAIGQVLKGQVNTRPNISKAREVFDWQKKIRLISDILRFG